MNNYPQYIHVPTSVPVQRFFADPYVPVNSYGLGDTIDRGIGAVSNLFGSKGKAITDAVNGFGSKIGLGGGDLMGAAGNLAYNVLGGKNKTGVGNALNAAAGIVGKVNPIAGLAVNGVAAFINRGWGSRRNDEGIAAFNADTNELNNTRVTDSSNESIANQAAAQNWGGSFSLKDMGETGWFNKNKFQDEFNKMMRARASGQNYTAANYNNASNNVTANMMDNMLQTSYAMGGFFPNPFAHDGSVAIAYGNEQQQLANQQQMLNQPQQPQMNMPQTIPGNKQYGIGGCIMPCAKFFAYGGMPNSHGGDFTNDLMYIDEGGSHEENPYQGVPMGQDAKGVPNVVEEGEIVVPSKMLDGQGDFVISNRTLVSEMFADKHPGTRGLTHAEAARKLTAESREVPNDPIAKATDKKILREIVDDQEQVKMEAQQQQMMMMQQMTGQPMQAPPEQAMMMPRGQMEGPAMEELMAQQQATPEQTMACGGRLHAFGGRFFDYGGPVNSFAAKATPIQRRGIVGHPFKPGYTDTTVWNGLMYQNAAAQIQDRINNASTPEELQQAIDEANALQKSWYAAYTATGGKFGAKDSSVRAHQDLARAYGLNAAFTQDNLGNYYDVDNFVNGTSDKYDAYGNDDSWGGFEQVRHLGRKGVGDEYVRQIQDWLRGKGVDYYLDPETDMYMLRKLEGQKPPESSAYDPEAAALYDEYFDKNGNPTEKGKAELDKAAITESQLEDFVKGVDAKNNGTPVKLYDESLRYAPIWASGIASLTDALGLTNRPDYSGARALEGLAYRNNNYMPVSYHTTGEQMRYAPYDPVLQTIMNEADTAATRRAIQDNVNGNAAARNAALFALNRQAGLTNGQLGLQARQYNDQLLNNTLTFNNGVNTQNSRGVFGADATNADNWARQRGMFSSIMGSAIEARQAEKARADAARALNLSNFVKGLGALGKENAYYNMVNTNASNNGYNIYRGKGVGYDPWGILYEQ